MIDITAIVKPSGLPSRKYGLIKANLKGDLWKTTMMWLDSPVDLDIIIGQPHQNCNKSFLCSF